MTSVRPSPDPVYVLRGSNSPVTCVHFPTCLAGHLYSGTQSGKVFLWNLETRRISDTLDGHGGSTILSVVDVDSSTLLTQGRDGLVILWENKETKWQPENHFKCTSQSFCASAIVKCSNSNASLLAVPSDVTSQVDIFDLDTGEKVTFFKPDSSRTKYGMCMAIKLVSPPSSDQCHQVLIGYESGHVALWDTKTSKMIDSLELYKESVMCLDYSSQMSKGLAGSADNTLKSFSIYENNKLTLGPEFNATNPGFSKIVFRPDSKIVTVAGWDCNIRIFSFKKLLKPLAVLSYHKQNVQSVDFSQCNLLACGSQDQLISMWDIYR
ncbi:guanine nucleotide-binding protein subunit beta-like protein 1 [Gigantopelta aegis]|uniref:guanine nucleotide-binding protein subunit beta-like protein 1 n=1 Tax=Gigantopelta aegis TaxID=1735272 RepID=UPI001B88CB52|nr:guanine nucleotide-binding protein subunit beta-like protein 1 [Gigantopelta aegis]